MTTPDADEPPIAMRRVPESRRRTSCPAGRACLVLSALSLAGIAWAGAAPAELPPRVEQILPRGGIPAVFAPEFVAADRASIPDDAWVLGVVVDGVAKAYSLNLLNRHEVVNDRSGGTAYAAVW